MPLKIQPLKNLILYKFWIIQACNKIIFQKKEINEENMDIE